MAASREPACQETLAPHRWQAARHSCWFAFRSLAEAAEQRCRHRVRFRAPLGVPLYAKAERRVVRSAHGLDQSILSESFGLQPISEARDALPVQRVDHDLVASDPVAQLAAQEHRVDWAVGLIEWDIGPGAVVLVSINVVHRLVQAAAKGDVQLLTAAADGK